jgi:hypothetical protein
MARKNAVTLLEIHPLQIAAIEKATTLFAIILSDNFTSFKILFLDLKNQARLPVHTIKLLF